MATEILAIGAGAASSSEVTVTAGVLVTVFMKTAAGGVPPSDAECDVLMKDDDAVWQTVAKFKGAEPAKGMDCPGTYRFDRVSGTFGLAKE